MPEPNPWEIILGLSNVAAWDHLLHITCAFASFSGLIFLPQNLPAHIYLDFNRPSLASFPNVLN